MAIDGLVLNPGSGGDTLAVDTIDSKQFQVIKLALGAEDVFDLLLDSGQQVMAASLPTVLASDHSDIKITLDSEAVVLGAGTAEIGKLAAGVAEIGNVKNSGTFAVQVDAALPAGSNTIGDVTLSGAALTSLALLDDVVATLGTTTYSEATTKGNVIGVVRNDVLAALGDTDNEVVPLQVDALGAQWIHHAPNLVSSANSSNSTLLSGATFTGTGMDMLGFGSVAITVDASHDSATDGMQFQFSTNDTDWDDVNSFTYTAADGARRFQFPVTAQYFRVVYINGGTNQTHFRLQTILNHISPSSPTVHRLVDNVDPDRSSSLVKSVTMAQAAGSGDFVPVQATAAGNFKVSLEEIDAALTGPGVEAAALLVTLATDSTGLLSVDDNGGSLTVDWNGTAPPIGAGVEATALRVTIATDSTGVLSVDDNGASLTVDNAGTFATQATLQANSGVDIGDVDVTDVIPGTGATNLGKAIGSAQGSTDTGITLLGHYVDRAVHTSVDDGDYDVVGMSGFNALNVEPEQHVDIDRLTSISGWSALGNDTLNLATDTNHVLCTLSLKFDKVNGDDNTVFGGIEKTITSVNLGDLSMHDIFQTAVYLNSVAAVDYVFLRLGTTSSAYNEWRIPGLNLSANIWETLVFVVGDPSFVGNTGDGWDATAITYAAIGVAFNSETDTLADIRFSIISFHTNQHVSASLNAEVTSSVSSANVNLQKIAGSPTDKGSGNASNGSQRIVIATNDVNQAAINAATAAIQTAVEGTLTVGSHAVTNAGTFATQATLQAGTAAFGKLSANSGVDIGDVDVTSIAAGANLIGDVGISGARTSGGTTLLKNIDVDEGAGDVIKDTAGQLFWLHAMNTKTVPIFLKFYNVAGASVSVGTTVPSLTFLVPANADNDGAGFVLSVPNGIEFSTAMSMACTLSVADNASDDPGAGACIVNLGFA